MEVKIKTTKAKIKDLIAKLACCKTTDADHPSPCVGCGYHKNPPINNIRVEGNTVIYNN